MSERTKKAYAMRLGNRLPYRVLQKAVNFKGNGHIALFYQDGALVTYEIRQEAPDFPPGAEFHCELGLTQPTKKRSLRDFCHNSTTPSSDGREEADDE